MKSGVDQPKTNRGSDAHVWHALLARAGLLELVRPVHLFCDDAHLDSDADDGYP